MLLKRQSSFQPSLPFDGYEFLNTFGIYLRISKLSSNTCFNPLQDEKFVYHVTGI